jgi:hypothetical protein
MSFFNLTDPPFISGLTGALAKAQNSIQEDIGVPFGSLTGGIQGISSAVNNTVNSVTSGVSSLSRLASSAPGQAKTAVTNLLSPVTNRNKIASNLLSRSNTNTGVNKTDSPKKSTSTGPVGRRKSNPLDDFSSFTYQISLYMLTPEAQNSLVAEGGPGLARAIERGEAVLVCQSGSSGQPTPDKVKRAPGFEKLDVYIDDLKFDTKTAIENNPATTSSIDFEFNIYEPYSISFVNRLTTAAKTILAKSKIPGISQSQSAINQHYAIAIRFFGYDKDGNVVTGDTYKGGNDVSLVDKNGLFERVFAIKITKIEFKLDGRVTCYKVTAANVNELIGIGQIDGRVKSNCEVSAITVGDAIQSFIDHMNDEQQKFLKPRKNGENAKLTITTDYKIEYSPDAITEIKNALLVNSKLKKEFDRVKELDGNNLGKINQTVNSSQNLTQVAAPNKNTKTFTIPEGQSIIQTIEQMIAVSSFPEKMVKVLKTNRTGSEQNPNGNSYDENKSAEPMKWFTITPKVEVKGFSKERNTFTYKITYMVQTYKVPYLRSAFGNPSQYLGPHKVYEYWYTGKNTNILSYEQNFNNLYYVKSAPDNVGNPAYGGITDTTAAPDAMQANRSARSAIPVEGVMTDLYSPGDTIETNIQITGDPDYIIYSTSAGLNKLFESFYGMDNFTINPTGGQVFVEIIFQQVTDFKKDDGTMDVNRDIRFYASAKTEAPTGFVYQLRSVKSSFSKGKFTQNLDAFLVLDDRLNNVYGGGFVISNNPPPNQSAPAAPANAGANVQDTPVSAPTPIEQEIKPTPAGQDEDAGQFEYQG